MGKYIKLFETTAQYNAYTADTANFILPNLSLALDADEIVYYHPYVEPAETRMVAKFNVTDTSNPTQILFNDSNAFTEIEVDGVVQPSVTTGYTFSTTGEHTVKYTLSSSTSMGNSAFSNCSNLTSVIIPSGVTKVTSFGFENCSSLTSITIPEGVTNIEYGGFLNCNSLTSLVMPSTITYFGGSSLKDCSSLTSLTILATTPPSTLGTDALKNTNNCIIYVPSESVNAYKTANKWSSYASRIQAIP